MELVHSSHASQGVDWYNSKYVVIYFLWHLKAFDKIQVGGKAS